MKVQKISPLLKTAKGLQKGLGITLAFLFILGIVLYPGKVMAQAGWKLMINGLGEVYEDHCRESDVMIGLDEADSTVPIPPPPPGGYTVFMRLGEQGSYCYKDVRQTGDDTESWLLSVQIDPNYRQLYPADIYPVLFWNPNDIAPEDDIIPGTMELRRGKTGAIDDRPLLVADMKTTNEYLTTQDDEIVQDGTSTLWYTVLYKPYDCTDAPWTVRTGLEDTIVVFGTATVNQEPAEEGDWVGAFGSGGVTDCRGLTIVGEGCSADGCYYMDIWGEYDNETITFKIVKCSTSLILNVKETIAYIGGGFTIENQTLTGGVYTRTQSIDMIEGWNWGSFNVLPEDTSLEAFFGDKLVSIEQIKSMGTSTTYSSYFDEWLGDTDLLSNISNGAMFKIKAKTAFTLNVTGTSLEPDLPIELVEGWTWVAYLPDSCLSLEEALASCLGENFYQIKCPGKSTTNTTIGLIGTLHDMCPNIGYKIMMKAPCTLIFPK